MALLQSAGNETLPSGGLRSATTTGYYLPALQAENRSLLFSHSLGSDWVPLTKEHLFLNEDLIQPDTVATASGSDIASRIAYLLFERRR